MNAQQKPPLRLFVTGTDTGVGKTVVSMLLMRELAALGYAPHYCKPIQTGCHTLMDADSDALFVYWHCPWLAPAGAGIGGTGDGLAGESAETVLGRSVGLRFAAPKAPLFAARDAGTTVDVRALLNHMAKVCKTHDAVVFEGAGGVLVPVTGACCMADLMRSGPGGVEGVEDAPIRAVVVGRAGLGTINHTLLTLEALRTREIPVAGVVLVQHPAVVASGVMVRENVAAVEQEGGVSVCGVVPPLVDFAQPCRCLQETVAQWFRSVREG